eukprot:CAMPEP_0178561098 /NCGR_PEP_ID=MMETSP0697-20121206/11829_1 /TAXON_ID=265572 /ORGANISM="Extubocellulus spinifer, Strain CCMP396" /LENGTH=78 /DNA_ID=CAMNT_0020194379 /DNA_START=38 /DNA_END=274 /DNA_ORIENTATION=-
MKETAALRNCCYACYACCADAAASAAHTDLACGGGSCGGAGINDCTTAATAGGGCRRRQDGTEATPTGMALHRRRLPY